MTPLNLTARSEQEAVELVEDFWRGRECYVHSLGESNGYYDIVAYESLEHFELDEKEGHTNRMKHGYYVQLLDETEHESEEFNPYTVKQVATGDYVIEHWIPGECRTTVATAPDQATAAHIAALLNSNPCPRH